MPGSSYDRFMGRYSEPLADVFVEWARPAARTLDVGAGPGALTARLVDRLGAEAVSAVDPSPSFLASLSERCPGVDVRRASAAEMPYADGSFAATAAQLVVHFMPDPVAGLAEMRRVTAPRGWVSACSWDLVGGRAPISLMWRAAHHLDPRVEGESSLPGTGPGQLTAIAGAAGLQEVEESELSVRVSHPSFEEWWEPYLLGVGPAGEHVTGLDESGRVALRERCRELLPSAPFELEAVAWAVRGRA